MVEAIIPSAGPWQGIAGAAIGLLIVALNLRQERDQKRKAELLQAVRDEAYRLAIEEAAKSKLDLEQARSELETLRAKLATTEEERDTWRAVAKGQQTCAWLDGLMGKGGLS